MQLHYLSHFLSVSVFTSIIGIFCFPPVYLSRVRWFNKTLYIQHSFIPVTSELSCCLSLSPVFPCLSSIMQFWYQIYRTHGWIIPLTYRCGAKTSAGTFCGCDLVNWLIEVGLASDRGEAVIYGDRLVQGGVIQHITNEYEFRDEYLFYRFLQKSPKQSPPTINADTPQQER